MKRPRWFSGDLPTTFGLTVSLWLCALILVAGFVAPFFGPVVGWGVAIAVLIILVPICTRITTNRTFRS